MWNAESNRGVFEFDTESGRVLWMSAGLSPTPPAGVNGGKGPSGAATGGGSSSGSTGNPAPSNPPAGGKGKALGEAVGSALTGAGETAKSMGKGKGPKSNSNTGTGGTDGAEAGAKNKDKKPSGVAGVLEDGYQAKSDKKYFDSKDHRKQLKTFLDRGKGSTQKVVAAEESGKILDASRAARYRREALEAQLDQLSYGTDRYEQAEAAYNGVKVTTQRNHILRSGQIGGNITLSDGSTQSARDWFDEQISSDDDATKTGTQKFIEALGEAPANRIQTLEKHGRLSRATAVTGAYAAALDAQRIESDSGGGIYDDNDLDHRLGQVQETLDRNHALLNGRLTQAEFDRYYTGREDQAVVDGILKRNTDENGAFNGVGSTEQQARQMRRYEASLQAQIKSAQADPYMTSDESADAVKSFQKQLADHRALIQKFTEEHPQTAVDMRGDTVTDAVPEEGLTTVVGRYSGQ